MVVNMCQCPNSGHPHFYKDDDSGFHTDVECVNALTRAFLISTSVITEISCLPKLCQCAISGFPHFYQGRGDDRRGI